jgi:hypothetical protein
MIKIALPNGKHLEIEKSALAGKVIAGSILAAPAVHGYLSRRKGEKALQAAGRAAAVPATALGLPLGLGAAAFAADANKGYTRSLLKSPKALRFALLAGLIYGGAGALAGGAYGAGGHGVGRLIHRAVE